MVKRSAIKCDLKLTNIVSLLILRALNIKTKKFFKIYKTNWSNKIDHINNKIDHIVHKIDFCSTFQEPALPTPPLPHQI